MVNESDIVVCYINRSWGGAAKYVEMATKKGKTKIENPAKPLFKRLCGFFVIS